MFCDRLFLRSAVALFLVKYNHCRGQVGQGLMKKEARFVLVANSDTGSFFAKTIDCLGQLMVGDVGLRGNNDSPGRYFRGLRVFFAQTVEIR